MSSTSSLLGHISVFRNPTADTQSVSYLNVVAAQCAYLIIVPYAIIEAAISQIVRAISYFVLDHAKYQQVASWAASSAYSVIWAVHCVFVNLCTKKIAPTENDFKANILKISPRPDPIQTPKTPIRKPDPIPFDPFEIVLPTPQPEQPDEPEEPEPATDNLMPQPIIAMPNSANPAIAKLLNGYELGNNAKQYSELMEKIYREIPTLTNKQLYRLGELGELLQGRGDNGTRNRIFQKFNEISIKICEKDNATVWEERLFKMTVAIYDAITKLEDDELEAGKEILVSGLLDAFENCSNRQSTEIERLYFRYVAPDLLAAVEAAATPVETLIFELMQLRTKMRDETINRICRDIHNAASHRYFREILNENVFYLPTPLLSAEDKNYKEYAQTNKAQEILVDFQERYNRPGMIYDVLIGLLYPKPKESFRFKPEMFVTWLKETNRMNADAFSDEDQTMYKPEIMIAFLEEQGFLRKI